MDINTLHNISYGLYVISSKSGDKLNGHISNTVFQVTAEPPQIAVCINKNNLTHDYVKESNVFTISILERDTSMQFIGHFGFKTGKDFDKFKDMEYKFGVTGAPIVLTNSLGYIECEVAATMDAGSHTLFVGKVVGLDNIKEGEPMTYAYYHMVKGGKSPKNAPTYMKDEIIEKKEGSIMGKYVCTVCGYIYEQDKGDPDSSIEPGTSFEDLPDDWVCPVCGVGKDQFDKVD